MVANRLAKGCGRTGGMGTGEQGRINKRHNSRSTVTNGSIRNWNWSNGSGTRYRRMPTDWPANRCHSNVQKEDFRWAFGRRADRIRAESITRRGDKQVSSVPCARRRQAFPGIKLKGSISYRELRTCIISGHPLFSSTLDRHRSLPRSWIGLSGLQLTRLLYS